MTIAAFLADLFETGRLRVPPPSKEPDTADVQPLLEERARSLALNFPGKPPHLDLEIARWAARQFYAASQLAIYRELDEQSVEQLLCHASYPAPAPVRHWSVDLTIAFLPDLIALARSASPKDPLTERLLLWAAEWPLSSVGVKDIVPRHANELAEHDGLMRLYLDRIFNRNDWPRLKDSTFHRFVRFYVGAYPSEWPALESILKSVDVPA
jgi:hypothetical protein